MSTDFRPLSKITMNELFDGRLSSFGIYEEILPGKTTDERRLLTDGSNWIWVDDDHGCIFITSYGVVDPTRILWAINEAFNTEIVSEHDPEYWGCSTWDEFYRILAQQTKEDEEQRYLNLIRYVRGEPNDIQPGTVDEAKAEIARRLVGNNPEVAQEGNERMFLRIVDVAWHREYAPTEMDDIPF